MVVPRGTRRAAAVPFSGVLADPTAKVAGTTAAWSAVGAVSSGPGAPAAASGGASKAPASQPAPSGRGVPRWSVGTVHAPAVAGIRSIAALPDPSAIVGVGPPLPWRGPSRGSPNAPGQVPFVPTLPPPSWTAGPAHAPTIELSSRAVPLGALTSELVPGGSRVLAASVE